MLRSSRNQRAAFLVMLAASLSVFLTALDQTVVVTALPQITVDLEIMPTELDRAAWIVSGYLLGYVIVMPLMGRVSDVYGRRRVFLLCLAIFALGSVLCGLAPELGKRFDLGALNVLGDPDSSSSGLTWLVLARFIQAAGGGAVVPVAMAIAGDLYGNERRGFALGLIGMVTEAGGVLGPLYGSWLVESLGWEYIFYLNLPLVLILAIPVWFFVPAKGVTFEQEQKQGIDYIGAFLFGASLLCLSLGLAQSAAQITPEMVSNESSNIAVQNNPWLVALALVFLVAFIIYEVWAERRGNATTITLSLFRSIRFSAASIVSFLVGAALIIAMVNIPLFFLTVYESDSVDSGIALLRLTVMIPIGALLGGWLCARITSRVTAIIGLIPTVVGFWFMYQWGITIDWNLITIGTMSAGLGLGLVIAPISTTAVNAAGNHRLGMASSVVTVLRMVGMILGLAALTSWGLGRFRALVAAIPSDITPFDPRYWNYVTHAAHDIYTNIFLAAGILCLVALIPALFLEGKQTSAVLERTKDKEVLNGRISTEVATNSTKLEN